MNGAPAATWPVRTISRRQPAGRQGSRDGPIKVDRRTSAATMPGGGGGRGARVATLNSASSTRRDAESSGRAGPSGFVHGEDVAGTEWPETEGETRRARVGGFCQPSRTATRWAGRLSLFCGVVATVMAQ